MGAGAVSSGTMVTGTGGGPFAELDVADATNEKEKQKSKEKTNPKMLRRSGLVEDPTVDEILDYLLQNLGSVKHANR